MHTNAHTVYVLYRHDAPYKARSDTHFYSRCSLGTPLRWHGFKLTVGIAKELTTLSWCVTHNNDVSQCNYTDTAREFCTAERHKKEECRHNVCIHSTLCRCVCPITSVQFLAFWLPSTVHRFLPPLHEEETINTFWGVMRCWWAFTEGEYVSCAHVFRKISIFFATVSINPLREKGIHYTAISILCPILSFNILKA